MRADNSAHLITAAARRHELARSKAIQAIRELDGAGTAMTFETVARAAGVSRSWLYTQPDIRAEVERLRDLGRRAPKTPVPSHHRSSDTSLLRRLETANARNREMTADNQQLRHQLAQALGQLRAAGVHQASEQASTSPPRRRSSVTIGPC
jgi:hypothetical protein